MNDNAEFYARVRERLAAARAYMDAAQMLIACGATTDAGTMLEKARAEQDAMLAEMREMNEESAK